MEEVQREKRDGEREPSRQPLHDVDVAGGARCATCTSKWMDDRSNQMDRAQHPRLDTQPSKASKRKRKMEPFRVSCT